MLRHSLLRLRRDPDALVFFVTTSLSGLYLLFLLVAPVATTML